MASIDQVWLRHYVHKLNHEGVLPWPLHRRPRSVQTEVILKITNSLMCNQRCLAQEQRLHDFKNKTKLTLLPVVKLETSLTERGLHIFEGEKSVGKEGGK